MTLCFCWGRAVVIRAAGQLVFILLSVAAMTGFASAQDREQSIEGRWAIALHGGAGKRSRDMSAQARERLDRALRDALTAGKEVLSKGGSSLDAVEAVVVMLEDDPQFNAGRGAVFTRNGEHELDASIMDGATLKCGAVAGVKFQKNPIKAARLVMERTPHILLAGQQADEFGSENGLEQVEQSYFYTENRFNDLQEALDKLGLQRLKKPAYSLPHDPQSAQETQAEGGSGTVGCVALDMQGNLAAATSTGGLSGKMPGRVGDTPVIGAGNYADKGCAVSGTGIGEQFIRHSVSARVAWLVAERELPLDAAVNHCLHKVLQPGDGGIIAVDREGRISLEATTDSMPRGAADSNGRFETAIWIDR
ncbi:MAG TPA: isoaspartyl peptidase/L-asparaginase [Lacipirellulaceae bacterium]|nr:isoaspartyl peptidase/L-asparaginase [Lacipirellulaceae bacterium]